jgi:hypothetical protein
MTVEVFDPELCCTTGVCGPAPDPELIRMAEALDRLAASGVKVARYQLSRQPTMFMANQTVYQKLLGEGTTALPMVAVDGVVHWSGRYPTYEELCQVLAEDG